MGASILREAELNRYASNYKVIITYCYFM